MMMEAKNKPNVTNPLTLRNTVGAELADIFDARGMVRYEDALGVTNLRSKEKLSKSTIRKAIALLGADDFLYDILKKFQEDYLAEKSKCVESFKEAKKNFTKLKNALLLMRGEFNDGYDRLDDILDFFNVDSEDEIFAASESQAALYRTQNGVEPDPINLHTWLRRGELEFEKLELPEYDENALLEWVNSRTWEQHIEEVDYFKMLPELFKQFGVALVYVPFLPKTVYGAVRWFNGRPLIEISDRNRDLATSWYTLFHEVGHVILHKNEDVYEGDIATHRHTSRIERQANQFASKHLFNGDNLRVAVFDRKRSGEPMTANSLAIEFGVAPILASYWLIKAQYAPTMQKHIAIDFLDGYEKY